MSPKSSSSKSSSAGFSRARASSNDAVANYRNAAWEPLPLKRAEMLELYSKGHFEEWKRKVVGRSNYWLFSQAKLRGENYFDFDKWKQVLNKSPSYSSKNPELDGGKFTRPNKELTTPPEA